MAVEAIYGGTIVGVSSLRHKPNLSLAQGPVRRVRVGMVFALRLRSWRGNPQSLPRSLPRMEQPSSEELGDEEPTTVGEYPKGATMHKWPRHQAQE